MKKVLALILALIMAMSVVSCGNSQAEGKSESDINESTASSSDKNELGENEAVIDDESAAFEPDNATGDMTTATQIMGDEQNGELPEIEGPDKFVELFVLNPIDTYYISEMEMASSVSSMLNITNDTMKYWEAEVNSVYSELSGALGESSAAYEKIKVEQKAWINDLTVATEEIKNEVGESVNGSMVNIEISYRLMLLYRGRAVELLCELYNVTGEVNIELLTDAAG